MQNQIVATYGLLQLQLCIHFFLNRFYLDFLFTECEFNSTIKIISFTDLSRVTPISIAIVIKRQKIGKFSEPKRLSISKIIIFSFFFVVVLMVIHENTI